MLTTNGHLSEPTVIFQDKVDFLKYFCCTQSNGDELHKIAAMKPDF